MKQKRPSVCALRPKQKLSAKDKRPRKPSAWLVRLLSRQSVRGSRLKRLYTLLAKRLSAPKKTDLRLKKPNVSDVRKENRW